MPTRQGKNGLVHSGDRSAHDVGSGPARHACVGVINVTTMSMAVFPILPTLVGCGRACGLLRTGTVAAKPSWLLKLKDMPQS